MTLLKCKNGHKWDYNGQNRKGEKATCPKCRKLVTIPSLIIAAMLLFGGLGVIYAEEIDLPLEDPYDDTWCIFLAAGDHVKFTCNWTWFLPDYVMVEVNQTTVPRLISEMPEHNADLAEIIRHFVEIGEPSSISKDDATIIEDPEPEEPLTAEAREIKYAVDTLAECRTGLGAWAAYQEQELIQNYADKTRWEFSIRDNLSQSYTIKQILLAIEECDIMKDYANKGLIGAYELNKILADLAGLDYLGRSAEHPLATKVTDQSDSMVFTDPVTARDIAAEVEEAQRIFDEKYRDPNAPFTGENRGGQPAGLKCQTLGQPAPIGIHPTTTCPLSLYDAHILKNWDNITYSDILTLQCDNFLYIYQHKIGTDDFPVWLNHCVPKVVREG